MKVDMNKLKTLDPYDGPEIEPGFIERMQDKIRGSGFEKPARWQMEGLIASVCVGITGLALMTVSTSLGPPGNDARVGPGFEIAVVEDAPDAHVEPDSLRNVKVRNMSLLPKEEEDVTTAASVAGDILQDAVPEHEEAAAEVPVIEETAAEETGIEEPVEEIEEALPEDEPKEDEPADVQEEEEQEPVIAVANVDTVLNVRSDMSEEADKVGVLYTECGGTVLEQKDGWTKIESGRLVGWVNDEYLLFDEDAETVAKETGTTIASVSAENLRVRQEPSTDADVLTTVKENDAMELSGILDDGWAEVNLNEKTGYVSLEFLDLNYLPKTGETNDEILEREEAEKAALKENAPKAETVEVDAELTISTGYEGTASDLEMLATIIYCEAGNQPYEGKVAVGNVVLNRMNSARFPNSINEIIRAPRQFSPVGNGRYDRVLGSGRVPEACYQAARDAMSGVSYVGECLFFKNPKLAGEHSGIHIGDHVFW